MVVKPLNWEIYIKGEKEKITNKKKRKVIKNFCEKLKQLKYNPRNKRT